MFLSKFLNFRNFYIFWGVAGVLIGVVWVRYLVEPKLTATSVGMTRLGALRALLTLSIGWYLVWAGVHVLHYFMGAT